MVFLCFVFARGTLDIRGAHLSICAIGTPLLVTVVSYAVLYVRKKKSAAKVRPTIILRRENNHLKTLFIVTLTFFLTWSPFVVANVLYTYSCY